MMRPFKNLPLRATKGTWLDLWNPLMISYEIPLKEKSMRIAQIAGIPQSD
jgi:hypothetical protein